MAQVTDVEGVEAFKSFIESVEDKSKLFVYFVSGLNDSSQYWCGDCTAAEPAVADQVSKASADLIFLKVKVGEKSFWKDQANFFRTELGITNIPTLMSWQSKKLLIEQECTDPDNVKAFFSQ